jgi:transcriptional regulator with XRE-family HTH domain
MAPPSPAVAQLELAIRLKRRRLQLNLSAKAVGDHLKFSPNHWSGVENNRTILAADKLTMLGGLFELADDEIKDLLALRDVARGPRWWDEYHYVLDERLAQFYGLEYGASSLRTFEASVIPGLLQTEEYAQALVAADPDATDARLPKRIELRLRRQERLFDDDPLRMSVLMSQAALMQQIGGQGVLKRQLRHLLELAQRLDQTTLALRVVPFTATPQGLLNASTMHLLDFPSRHLPTILWRESVEPLGISDDRDLIDLVIVSFDLCLASALSHENSLKLIEELAEGLGDN